MTVCLLCLVATLSSAFSGSFIENWLGEQRSVIHLEAELNPGSIRASPGDNVGDETAGLASNTVDNWRAGAVYLLFMGCSCWPCYIPYADNSVVFLSRPEVIQGNLFVRRGELGLVRHQHMVLMWHFSLHFDFLPISMIPYCKNEVCR